MTVRPGEITYIPQAQVRYEWTGISYEWVLVLAHCTNFFSKQNTMFLFFLLELNEK